MLIREGEMNSIEKLQERILSDFPDAETHLDEPIKKSGSWFLDISLGSRKVTIEWKPYQGFGFSDTARPTVSYGERPDKTCTHLEEIYLATREHLLAS